MNSFYAGILAGMLAFTGMGCATSPAKGSSAAGDRLLKDDQHAIEKADASYRDAVLKHGQTSDEAVKGKTNLDNAKNKYIADQGHVEQLKNINGQQSPVDSSTQAPSDSSGKTTTTTTTTIQH